MGTGAVGGDLLTALRGYQSSHVGAAIRSRGSRRGSPNPRFWEWMMGFPEDFTA